MERPFVVYLGYKCATARSMSERIPRAEVGVKRLSLEFMTVRPFSMALKRLGDLKAVCQRKRTSGGYGAFFSLTKKRKQLANNETWEQVSVLIYQLHPFASWFYREYRSKL